MLVNTELFCHVFHRIRELNTKKQLDCSRRCKYIHPFERFFNFDTFATLNKKN